MSVIAFLRNEPRTRWPAFFSFVIRVPAGSLALLLPLLALHDHMSPAISGASLATCRAAQAISGPAWGRAVDKTSLRTVLFVAGIGLCLALITLSIASLRPWQLLVLAGVIGSLLLPMNALMRALWNSTLTSDADKSSATAFESGMTEGILLFARLAVALTTLVLPVGAVIGSQTALVVIGVVGLTGCELVRSEHHPIGASLGRGALDSRRGLFRRYGCFLLLATSLGAFSVVLIFAAGGDGTFRAAVSVAAWGLGSLGGLLVVRGDRLVMPKRLSSPMTLLLVMGAFQLVAAAHRWSLGPLLLAAFIAGLPIAAIVTAMFDELAEIVQSDRQAEYFAWATTMIIAGDGLGALMAGFAFGRSHSQLAAVCTAAASSWIAATCWRSSSS